GTVVKGEPALRRDAPGEPGRVAAVAGEGDVVILRLAATGAAELAEAGELLDRHGLASRQCALDSGAAAFLVSLENAHLLRRAMEDVTARFGARARLDEHLGTVSCVGAGINARHDNLARALRR